MQDWLSMSATDLGRGIGRGEIDPVALTGAYLDAIEAHPLKNKVYSAVTAGRANGTRHRHLLALSRPVGRIAQPLGS